MEHQKKADTHKKSPGRSEKIPHSVQDDIINIAQRLQSTDLAALKILDSKQKRHDQQRLIQRDHKPLRDKMEKILRDDKQRQKDEQELERTKKARRIETLPALTHRNRIQSMRKRAHTKRLERRIKGEQQQKQSADRDRKKTDRLDGNKKRKNTHAPIHDKTSLVSKLDKSIKRENIERDQDESIQEPALLAENKVRSAELEPKIQQDYTRKNFIIQVKRIRKIRGELPDTNREQKKLQTSVPELPHLNKRPQRPQQASPCPSPSQGPKACTQNDP